MADLDENGLETIDLNEEDVGATTSYGGKPQPPASAAMNSMMEPLSPADDAVADLPEAPE